MLKTKYDKEELGYLSNHHITPLHNATYFGNLEVVKYLIMKGSDVNAKTTI